MNESMIYILYKRRSRHNNTIIAAYASRSDAETVLINCSYEESKADYFIEETTLYYSVQLVGTEK